MKEVFRNVIAALAGAFAGMVCIIASQVIASQLFPVPETVDRANKQAMGEFFASAPTWVLSIVLAGYFVGTATGAWVAGRLSAEGEARQPVMVGGLFFVASLMNLMSFPHPEWFWALNLAAVVIGTWLGVVLVPDRPHK